MNRLYSRLLLSILLITIFESLFLSQVNAQFTITENFKGSSVGSNIILGGNPSSVLTSGVFDPVNNGWLRLTTDATNVRGFAYIDTPFPSSIGVYVEFEYKTWRSTSDNTYNGADGISLFLFDATKTFSIGAFGGSLGYANQTNVAGLEGAYIGVGLDEYGNFAMNSEGKNGGTASLAPNSIVLRGPKNHAQPYRYLTHVQLQTNSSSNTNSIDYNTVTSTRPTDSQFYRKVKIYIEPIGTVAAPKYRIRVSWTTTVGGTDVQHMSYETTDPIPAKLKLGFAASTGGGFNFHEIRNVFITTPGGVRISKEVDKTNAYKDDVLTYTVNVHNETATKLNGMVLNDTIRDGNGNVVSLSDFQISSITFNNKGNTANTAVGYTSGVAKTTGFTNPFSATMSLDANSSASFTIVGQVKKIPQGGILKNSVAVDPSATGITDADLTNNFASVSTTILSPLTDLKIEKGVNNNGIARLSGNTYTITVSNVSANTKAANRQVTVTDVIPAGLTVSGYTATGWTVTNSGNTYTFKRSDALAPMYAYNPIVINVTPTGKGPWVNTATLSCADDTDASNNSSSVELKWLNYWQGTVDTDWAKSANWTANYVPASGEDVEFATVANNGASGAGNGTGAAVRDLYLDTDRVIGNLINNSDMNMVVTTGNQLVVNGSVQDANAAKGTIIVKTATDSPTGTLLFKNPLTNTAVNATVEFYNKAYECATCGFYKKQWQYFGIPVSGSAFPSTGVETVNQWVEPYNGNKWRPAPYTPDTELKAFKGYEITNSTNAVPTRIYSFSGKLNVGDADVAVTNSLTVNYPGMNLIANSYTAAIPISKSAIVFGAGLLADETVYLFNTGSRDDWRKLNGSTVSGVSGGQYQAVPINLAGQNNLPDRILSMHTFMVNAAVSGSVKLKYSELVKNELVNQTAWRSSLRSARMQLPYVVMDVIGDVSADRVWLFENEEATAGFDTGWDGYKLLEEERVQVYVEDYNDAKYQIATVNNLIGTAFGVGASPNEGYSISLSVAPEVESRNLQLKDLYTGRTYPLVNNAEYVIPGVSAETASRFKIVDTTTSLIEDKWEAEAISIHVENNRMIIRNLSSEDCDVAIYDVLGRFVAKKPVTANSEGAVDGSLLSKGVYIVKILSETKSINKTQRVLIK